MNEVNARNREQIHAAEHHVTHVFGTHRFQTPNMSADVIISAQYLTQNWFS
jgi:hypothetical protein